MPAGPIELERIQRAPAGPIGEARRTDPLEADRAERRVERVLELVVVARGTARLEHRGDEAPRPRRRVREQLGDRAHGATRSTFAACAGLISTTPRNSSMMICTMLVIPCGAVAITGPIATPVPTPLCAKTYAVPAGTSSTNSIGVPHNTGVNSVALPVTG